jgi:hypothetical protein
MRIITIFKNSALLLLSTFVLTSCGSLLKNDRLLNQVQSHIPEDGRYHLSAVTVEATDTEGNIIETSPIQVLGQSYFWTFKSLGDNEYEITATGSTSFTSNNQTFLEWKCNEARDVFVFEMSEENTIRNLRMLESGCPQGFLVNNATQLSLETIAVGAFQFNLLTQGNGIRSVERFTFRQLSGIR